MTRLLLLAACALFAASAAGALTIDASALGGDKGCVDLACTTQTSTWTSSSGTGGGSITLSGTSLTFDISIGSALFTGMGGNPNVTFDSVSYTGSATVSSIGPLHTVTSGSATIAGNFEGGAFSTPAITVGGTCTETGSVLACGLIFSLGNPADGNSYFHTVNLSTVPEPSTAALLGMGLIGGLSLASPRRKR